MTPAKFPHENSSRAPRIKMVRLHTAAPFGAQMEMHQSLWIGGFLDGKAYTLYFDADPRFLRLESATGVVDLIPISNVATIRLDPESAAA